MYNSVSSLKSLKTHFISRLFLNDGISCRPTMQIILSRFIVYLFFYLFCCLFYCAASRNNLDCIILIVLNYLSLF